VFDKSGSCAGVMRQQLLDGHFQINLYGSSLSTVGNMIFHEGRLKRSLPVIK
jgi:hypothetical protein